MSRIRAKNYHNALPDRQSVWTLLVVRSEIEIAAVLAIVIVDQHNRAVLLANGNWRQSVTACGWCRHGQIFNCRRPLPFPYSIKPTNGRYGHVVCPLCSFVAGHVKERFLTFFLLNKCKKT